MTAKDCLSHEWLYDIFHPVKGPVGALEDSSARNQVNNSDNCDEGSETSDTITVSSSNLDGMAKSESRDKMVDQQSEMSLDESVSDDNIVRQLTDGVKTEEEDIATDRKPVDHDRNKGDQAEHVNDNECIVNAVPDLKFRGCDTGVPDGGRVDTTQPEDNLETCGNSMDLKSEQSTAAVPSVACNSLEVSTEDKSPETDSSMCIPEIKAVDTDSGVATGSDSKSGRESVELDLLSEEKDGLDESTDDAEMTSRSNVELSATNDNSKGPENCIRSDGSINVNNNQGTFKGETNVVVNEIEQSESMELEHGDTVFDSVVSESVKMNSTNILKTTEHSKMSVSLDEVVVSCDPNLDISNSFDENTSSLTKGDQTLNQCLNVVSIMHSFGEVPNVSSSTPIKHPHIGSSGGRSSVGSIDDSINSMQLGERLKRGMCNQSMASGNAEDEDEEEYKFVSVSKRVRSIEDSMNSPRSPPFSPKIPRSPRVGRHSRSHYHQHH